MSRAGANGVGFSPDDLAAYLTQQGWKNDTTVEGLASVWHRVDDDAAEISVPLKGLSDYYARMQDALSDLQEFERRDRESIRRDVVNLGSGVMTVRVKGADTSEGAIPLKDGILLVQRAKDLLIAAAQSLAAKKRFFQGRLADELSEYIDSVQLGQTQVGSYVINVIAPKGPIDRADSRGDADVGSVLFQNLAAGIEALHLATGSSIGDKLTSTALLEDAVNAGASANMCQSLLGFSGKLHSRNFSLSISVPQGSLFPKRNFSFDFEGDRIAGLRGALEYYKGNYVQLGREVEGFVKNLSRPTRDEGGRVTLEAYVDGVERSISIELEASDYHVAISAHDSKVLVRCTGDLHVKPKGADLLNPSNFGLVHPPEELL